jgi:hypothetical protein
MSKAHLRAFRTLFLWLGTAFLLAGGCLDQSGDVAADRGGDLSHTLRATERAAPDAHLASACGEPVRAPGAPKILRTPYLQKVTDHTATVMWTSTVSADLTVDLWPAAATSPQVASAAVHPVSVYSQVEKGVKPGGGGLQHGATFDDLTAATTYCYSIRQGDTTLIGPTAFTTAPAAGAGAPVRFVAFSDSGSGGADQDEVMKQLHTVPFQLMIHTGDIAYDGGKAWELEQHFFSMYAPLLSHFPVFPASGNHDYATDDAQPFRDGFALPENGGPEGKERWYSYNWGDVHFVALDTEKTGEVQARWLDADLARNTRPWTIVYGHKPPYSSGYHGSDGDFQKWFVPILEKHHVPLVLNGHDHNYERTRPLNGVTYVVTGGGGRGTKGVGHSWFTAYSDQVLNFVYVTVDDSTLTLHAIDATGREFDSVQISRPGESPTASR